MGGCEVRKALLALLALLLVVGCKGYDEHQKLNYLDDVDAIVQAHRKILEVSPQDLAGEFGLTTYRVPMVEMKDAFKRNYQGTAIDKDFQFLVKIEDLQGKLDSYQTFAWPQNNFDTDEYLSHGHPDRTLAEYEADHKRTESEYRQTIDQVEQAVKEAQE
jgi:hypothetical protein